MGDDERDPPKMKTDGWGEEVTVIYKTSHGFGGGGGDIGGGGGGGLVTVDRASRTGGGAPPPPPPGSPEPTATLRTAIRLPWTPGFNGRPVQLTNEVTTAAGVGHPANTGSGGTLGFFATDASGNVITGHMVELAPGQSIGWYHAPPGATAIFVANIDVDDGYGDAELTYDTPMY